MAHRSLTNETFLTYAAMTVLHRIMVSGSDRACEKWLVDYAIPGVDGLALHHFYRGMVWLGEELDDAGQTDATPFSPRTIKDAIEERLFARRQDLFTDLSVVFMDTTSLSFEGEGGEALGRVCVVADRGMISAATIKALEERQFDYIGKISPCGRIGGDVTRSQMPGYVLRATRC